MKKQELVKILSNLKKNNIALVGHMGSGKSIIGKVLSKKFNFEHFDSDSEITKYTNKSINKVFQEDGEIYFRKIEKEIIHNLIEKKNIILSLGGGSILNNKIRKLLSIKSITLFLDVNIAELVRRLQNTNKRPLLNDTNIKKTIKNLDSIRRKYYLLSDIRINNSKSSPYTTCKIFAQQLINLYEKNNKD